MAGCYRDLSLQGRRCSGGLSDQKYSFLKAGKDLHLLLMSCYDTLSKVAALVKIQLKIQTAATFAVYH